MKLSSFPLLAFCACCLLMLPACADDSVSKADVGNDNGEIVPDVNDPVANPDIYSDTFRPQIHFTPAQYWMNDPNGMVYLDGMWHLFYQYNPYANVWGNMSWGHAVSSDLVHWDEKPVALIRDNLGDIFSGSAVIDHEGTAGFGKGAMVCLYTSSGQRQQQSMAYSTDGGVKFTTFSGNPIIANSDKDDFRDPKVFWHEQSRQWIMSLARGWQYAIDFYASDDLKSWHFLSSFSAPSFVRCNKGQWECPDLVQFGDKWVLLVSTNPGGPTSGSGTMYFVGNFDGKSFVADAADYPLWLDYGMDNYAGVTWSNAGSRKVLIGWMNNWTYAGDVPCSPWRSAMTLPRELSLVDVNGSYLLSSKVVPEIDDLAGEWLPVNGTLPVADAYHLRVTVDLSSNHTISLGNSRDEHYDIDIKANARLIIAHRNAKTGQNTFNGLFSMPSVQAPIHSSASHLTLDIYVDRSSVEIVSEDGTTNITNLVFPSSVYNSFSVDGNFNVGNVRVLKSIWK